MVLIPAMIIPAFVMADDPENVFLFGLSQSMITLLAMFIVIGITDKLDGVLARYLDQCTPLGAKLDTIADMVFYPLIALWLYRFESQVADGWWLWIFILLGLFFIKMGVGKIKFGYIPAFHTIGAKTFSASLYFFMIIAILRPEIASQLFPFMCVIGYANQLEETYILFTRDSVDENIRSVFS